MLQERNLAGDPNWLEVQQALSSLCGVSILIYDPKQKKPCAPAVHENSACLLVHEIGKEFSCFESYDESVGIALQSNRIQLFQCQAKLSYFVVPIRLNPDVSYAIIGGHTYLSATDVVAFREKAQQWGIAPKRLAILMKDNTIGNKESLLQKAQNLQTIGTPLIEAVHGANLRKSNATYMTTLTQIAHQLRNEPLVSVHYATLLNSIGILFNLESASIFKQCSPKNTYQETASFGQFSPNFDASAISLDLLIGSRKQIRRPIFIDDAGELHEAGFPIGTRSCHIFPLSESLQCKTTLAIFNTPLSNDETEMIAAFCLQAGVALDMAALQHKVSGQKKTITALSSLTSFNFRLKEEALYKNLLDQTTQLLNAEQGSLMVLDDKKEELSVMAMTNVNPALFSLFNKKLGEGVAGQVCQSRAALLVDDVWGDKRISHTPRPRYKTPSFLSVPLVRNEASVGVVSVADKVGGHRFTEEDLSLLTAMGSFLTMAIERSHLHTTTEVLKEISITDSLTGLLNQRYFYERLTEEIERTKRHGLPTCLIMIDIDDFKQVNDTHGHPAGDAVLKWLARLLRNTIRAIDVGFRYGGEEFTVILPNTTTADARVIAERICSTIHKKSRLQQKVPQLSSLTVSVGLANFPEDAESVQELIKHADSALYQAKHYGKNRTVVYKDMRTH